MIATGRTREETIGNFRDALRFHLGGLRERGLPAPDVTEFDLRASVPA